MTKNQVVLEVAEIKGRCPVYAMGNKIVIDPVDGEDVSLINLRQTDAICTRILGGALISYHAWFENATPSPNDTEKVSWQRALGPDYSKCPMIGPPYSTCGYVVFKVYGVPRGETR